MKKLQDTSLGPEKDRVLKTVQSILETHPAILFAYVFGSFVTAGHYRDIDLGVFLEGGRAESTLKVELGLEGAIQEAVRIPADVRVLNRAPLGFVYSVLQSGVLLVDRDDGVRADFEGLTYKRYLDFQHLRKQYLREIINAPV